VQAFIWELRDGHGRKGTQNVHDTVRQRARVLSAMQYCERMPRGSEVSYDSRAYETCATDDKDLHAFDNPYVRMGRIRTSHSQVSLANTS
jgi:hypothetical protein